MRRFKKMKRKCWNKGKNSSLRQPSVNAMNDGEKLEGKIGNCRQEKSNEGMEIPMKSQVDVCDICGHRGFSNALMYCSECSDSAVHQYCLGIPPGSINDTFDWFCEYCSPLVEFENQNTSGATSTRVEESFEGLAMAHEIDIEQYKNAMFPVVEELEPLCILPPLLRHGSSERKGTSNQCRIAEVTPITASTFMCHSLNCREEHDSSVSCFMENPEEIMSGLVLLATPSGEITIHRGLNFYDGFDPQIVEDPKKTGSISLDHPLIDWEESNAPVPFLQESSKETMSELALLASPLGEITSFFPDLATSNKNSRCNEVNSDKLVNELGHVVQETLELGDPSFGMDVQIDVGHLNVDPDFYGGAIDACQQNISEVADARKVIVVGLPAVGTESFRWTNRKRKTLVKFDLIPSLGPKCKRARSKRCRIPRSLSVEVGACKFTIPGVPAIGEERSDRPINGPEVVRLRKTLNGMSQADTFLDVPLKMVGLHVEAVSQECGLFNSMVDTSVRNVEERASEVDDRINDDQGLGQMAFSMLWILLSSEHLRKLFRICAFPVIKVVGHDTLTLTAHLVARYK